jgi:hypothetical protein
MMVYYSYGYGENYICQGAPSRAAGTRGAGRTYRYFALQHWWLNWFPCLKKAKRKFGTGKGKVRILDPHCFNPTTDVEVDAFLEGRY